MTKDSIHTELILNLVKQQGASVETKGKQPIIVTEFDESESETLELDDSENEEYDVKEELEEEDEKVPIKTSSKPSVST